MAGGQVWFTREWTTRRDRQVAANAQWVFVTSWWQGSNAVRMAGSFRAEDLADFEPLRQALMRGPLSQARGGTRLVAARRPPNVILIVLESVAARWTSLNHGLVRLDAEAQRPSRRAVLVFDNFYAHIGRSSNSLGVDPAVDLSRSSISATSPSSIRGCRAPRIASVFHDRGYRTAFITPSDLDWADWRTFLDGRGFGEVLDHDQLPCPTSLSSWGMEDRCVVDGMIEFIEQDPARPFFLMAWTTADASSVRADARRSADRFRARTGDRRLRSRPLSERAA